MNIKVPNLRKVIEGFKNGSRSRNRNVVYRIGYKQFFLKRIFFGFKNYVTNPKTKQKFKDLGIAIKNLLTR